MMKRVYLETYMKCCVALSEFWRWDELFGRVGNADCMNRFGNVVSVLNNATDTVART